MNIQSVLLVDDDQHIRKLAKMTLEKVGGWQVRVAASGLEALEILKSARPDLILLDVMMPNLCGRATLTSLKSDQGTASIPVILMTAKIQSGELDELMALGAAGIIVKPFDPLKLPEEIHSLVRHL